MENKKINNNNFIRNNDPFLQKVISIKRISKTVKGGRHMHFNALVAIGNLKGEYGFAISKNNEVSGAIKKSFDRARRNIHKVTIVKNDTILHNVIGFYNATKVYLKPAIAGTGIIAGGPVRIILELCGFKNVVSKIYGSRTSINVVRATYNALNQLEKHKKIVNLRGK